MRRMFLFAAAVFLSLVPSCARRGTTGRPGGIDRYQRVREKELVRLLSAFKVMGEKDFDHLSVRVIAVPGEPGSAGLLETGEVSTTVYVVVSEHDEYPEQRAFRLAPLYAPELERLGVEAGKPVVRLAWGPEGKRRRLRILVTLEALALQEEPAR